MWPAALPITVSLSETLAKQLPWFSKDVKLIQVQVMMLHSQHHPYAMRYHYHVLLNIKLLMFTLKTHHDDKGVGAIHAP